MENILKYLFQLLSISTIGTIIISVLKGEFNSRIKKVTGDSKVVAGTNDTYTLKSIIFLAICLIAINYVILDYLDFNDAINKKIYIFANIIYCIIYIFNIYFSQCNRKKVNIIKSNKVFKFKSYKYNDKVWMSLYLILNLIIDINFYILIKYRNQVICENIFDTINHIFYKDKLLITNDIKMMQDALIIINLISFIIIFIYIIIFYFGSIIILGEWNFYSVISSFKKYKFYLLESNNEKVLEGYLIGEFDGFYKIKKETGSIVYINKGQIKEMREIGTVDIKDNEKFKCSKKFIWGYQYEIQKKIKQLSKDNKENIKITYNKIYTHYNNNEYSVEQYICRRRKLDIQSNGNDNLIYGIMGGLMVAIGTGIANKGIIVIAVTIIMGFIMNLIFFKPRCKSIRKDFLITKEKEILDKKIDELLNLNTSLICKDVEKSGDLVNDKNESYNNKENIN